MGGYNSGRKASGAKCVEDFYTLDICQLYRQGFLKPRQKTVIRFGQSFAIKLECKINFGGWDQCLHVKYPVWNEVGQIETKEQIIGIEWFSTLKGKTYRPYFYCPMLEIRAGKLLMGKKGFAHRRWYGPLYHGQTLGHFDRSIRSCRAIKDRLGDTAAEFATDSPQKPKGMHQKTYRNYLKKHRRASLPALSQMGLNDF
ncbi:hypothetical protein [uncultured Endozoicomonas sp.]|uniref:hypothetical protein n=1 Tax=uncultured Endozoicomonas sp. TaxID=432652 RepID=UPI0026263116|nr:hypothetical protein [uncultured Endozoicomonas sp.]